MFNTHLIKNSRIIFILKSYEQSFLDKMRIFHLQNLLMIELICFLFINCNTQLSHFYKAIKIEKFYQITLFLSENITESLNQTMSLFSEYPSVIYSVNSENQAFNGNLSENSLQKMFSLQESLVFFYTNDLQKTKSFLNFLVPQLSNRKRPNCLIMCLSVNCSDNINLIDTLKYAWEENFLDFTVMKINLEDVTTDSSTLIHYFNSFNEVFTAKI